MKYISYIVIIIVGFLSFKQEPECANIKNGTFKYYDNEKNEIFEIRKDSIQVDSCPALGLILYSKVKWLSDCNYQTTLYKSNFPEFHLIDGTTFQHEIINIKNNEITLKTKTANQQSEREITMQILD